MEPIVLMLALPGFLLVIFLMTWAEGSETEALELLKKHDLLGSDLSFERTFKAWGRYYSIKYSIFSIQKDNIKIEVARYYKKNDPNTSIKIDEYLLFKNEYSIRILRDNKQIFSRNNSGIKTVLNKLF